MFRFHGLLTLLGLKKNSVVGLGFRKWASITVFAHSILASSLGLNFIAVAVLLSSYV